VKVAEVDVQERLRYVVVVQAHLLCQGDHRPSILALEAIAFNTKYFPSCRTDLDLDVVLFQLLNTLFGHHHTIGIVPRFGGSVGSVNTECYWASAYLFRIAPI
jgi:hypothetical protein